MLIIYLQLFLVFIIILILLKCAPCLRSFFRMKRMLKPLKGPKPLLLVGNVLDLLTNSTNELFRRLKNWHTIYGDVYLVSLGVEFGVFLKNPQDVEIILNNIKYIEKSREYSYVEAWLGTGLLTSTGAKWSTRRKLITPTFHFNILKQFIPIIGDHTRVLIKKLDQVADRKAVDIMPYIHGYTLDAICETAMGVNLDSQNIPDIPYVKAVKIASELFMKRSVSIIGRFNFTYKWLSPDYTASKKVIRQMHAFTNGVIKQRRGLLAEAGAMSSCGPSDTAGSKRKLAFLDMLLQSDAMLSDQDIREEVDTFMFEGHDTTAIVLAFSLMLLSRNGHVQKKLYEELTRVLGDEQEGYSLNQLNELKYLECVIKESLRLYPSVPIIGRTLREDVKLSTGVVLPSGVLVFLSIFSMHRDERNFDDAEKFIPERFGDTWTRRTTNFGYVPFSAGPRNCIGQKFAILELKYALASIILNFELLPTEDTPELTAELVLRTLNGVTVKIVRRNKA